MKILYLVHQFFPDHYTGTEKVVLNLATMMQKRGHRVKVVTYSLEGPGSFDHRIGGILYKEFVYKGIPVLALRHPETPIDVDSSFDDAPLSDIASELIQREAPDVAHVVHGMRQTELVWALMGLGIPYVMTLTDYFLLCPKVNLITSANDLCEGPEQGSRCARSCAELETEYIAGRLESAQTMLSGAGLVASPSRFLAGLFNREFKDLDIRIIRHGLNYGDLKASGRQNGGPSDRAVVNFGYAGSLNPHKGVHLLIEAFQDAASDRACLKIYGSGPDVAYFASLKKLAGNDRRIQFCGVYSSDRLGEMLGGLDAVVIPSLCYESYSLILHEAMACGVPVIASDVGGLGERLEDGVDGFLFRMGDGEGLASLIRKIAEDPEVLGQWKGSLGGSEVPGMEEEAYAYDRAYRILVESPTFPSDDAS